MMGVSLPVSSHYTYLGESFLLKGVWSGPNKFSHMAAFCLGPCSELIITTSP